MKASSFADLHATYAPAVSRVNPLPHQIADHLVIIVIAMTEGIPVRRVKPETAAAKSASVKSVNSASMTESTSMTKSTYMTATSGCSRW